MFDDIPCNEEVKIQIWAASYQPDIYVPATYKRFISCDKPIINLGKMKIKKVDY